MKVAALCLALVTVGFAQAQVILDDFTTGPATISVTSGQTYWQQSGSMIGGQRTESLDITQNPYFVPLDVNILDGFASISEGSNMISNDAIGYGYTASQDHSSISTFDLGLNLSAETFFTLSFLYNQSPMTADIMLNNNQADIFQFSVAPASSATYYQVAFSQFAGVDFSDIHQISVGFQDPVSNDFTLASFTAGPTPEPVSVAFLGLGVVGLIARKRKK